MFIILSKYVASQSDFHIGKYIYLTKQNIEPPNVIKYDRKLQIWTRLDMSVSPANHANAKTMVNLILEVK